MAWMQIVCWTTAGTGYLLLAWWVMRRPRSMRVGGGQETRVAQPFPVELQDDPTALVEE